MKLLKLTIAIMLTLSLVPVALSQGQRQGQNTPKSEKKGAKEMPTPIGPMRKKPRQDGDKDGLTMPDSDSDESAESAASGSSPKKPGGRK